MALWSHIAHTLDWELLGPESGVSARVIIVPCTVVPNSIRQETAPKAASKVAGKPARFY